MLPSCFGFCFVAPESITHTNNCTSQFCSILYSISTLSLIRCHYFYPTEHNVRLFFHVQETCSIFFNLRILPIPSSLSCSTSITYGMLATNATNTLYMCFQVAGINTKKYDKNCAVQCRNKYIYVLWRVLSLDRYIMLMFCLYVLSSCFFSIEVLSFFLFEHPEQCLGIVMQILVCFLSYLCWC